MQEAKIAHLGFIQEIITRMASNSFLLKGWSVTLVAALFALAARDSNKVYAWLTYFPILIFWLLDAFYLRQEKLYRALYTSVANDQTSSDHFTLDTTPQSSSTPSLLECAASKTLFLFYGPLVALVFIIVIST